MRIVALLFRSRKRFSLRCCGRFLTRGRSCRCAPGRWSWFGSTSAPSSSVIAWSASLGFMIFNRASPSTKRSELGSNRIESTGVTLWSRIELLTWNSDCSFGIDTAFHWYELVDDSTAHSVLQTICHTVCKQKAGQVLCSSMTWYELVVKSRMGWWWVDRKCVRRR